MRKEILFQNGYSRLTGILIVLLLSFQTAVAQVSTSMDSDSSIEENKRTDIEVQLKKGTIICNNPVKYVVFDYDNFKSEDITSLYASILYWTEYSKTASYEESQIKHTYSSKCDHYPIEILDSSLVALLMKCSVSNALIPVFYSQGARDIIYIQLNSNHDCKLFVQEYKGVKSIQEISVLPMCNIKDVNLIH